MPRLKEIRNIFQNRQVSKHFTLTKANLQIVMNVIGKRIHRLAMKMCGFIQSTQISISMPLPILNKKSFLINFLHDQKMSFYLYLSVIWKSFKEWSPVILPRVQALEIILGFLRVTKQEIVLVFSSVCRKVFICVNVCFSLCIYLFSTLSVYLCLYL